MFKILSGDFEKTAIYTNDKIIESKGLKSITTALNNAEFVRPLNNEEIQNYIDDVKFIHFKNDLKKVLKGELVCFEYKFKNGKSFIAITDKNTSQKVKQSGEIVIDEEKLTTVSKNIGCLIVVIVFLLICFILSIGNNKESNIPDNNIKYANQQQINYIKGFLKPGFQIVDESKVYYAKSKDYQNAYFVGTMVKNGNRLELCMWISNDFEEANKTLLSANDGAISSSYPLDARKTNIQIKTYDDGYNKIHSKVLQDFNKLAN